MSYINFIEIPAKNKTKVWKVFSVIGYCTLGQIQFRPQWRKYVFLPAEDTIFDKDCLLSVAAKCHTATIMWRKENIHDARIQNAD